jgi:hypothetical protein
MWPHMLRQAAPSQTQRLLAPLHLAGPTCEPQLAPVKNTVWFDAVGVNANVLRLLVLLLLVLFLLALLLLVLLLLPLAMNLRVSLTRHPIQLKLLLQPLLRLLPLPMQGRRSNIVEWICSVASIFNHFRHGCEVHSTTAEL